MCVAWCFVRPVVIPSLPVDDSGKLIYLAAASMHRAGFHAVESLLDFGTLDRWFTYGVRRTRKLLTAIGSILSAKKS